MRPARPATAGFTLIELMVTIAVMFSFFLMAIPSFATMRQRAALRGAGDEVLAFWNEARFEAVKRNQMVKVGAMRVGVDVGASRKIRSRPASRICAANASHSSGG